MELTTETVTPTEQKEALKQATDKLDGRVKERRKHLDAGRKNLSRSHDEYRKRIARAETAVTDAGKSNKVASLPLGRLKLYDDRIDVNGKSFPLTPEVQATVDTAGNLSSTRRHTLTRFALIGPFSLFTPKKTKHDDRELFLLVEGPDWAELLKCDVRLQAATRSLAKSINVTARQVEKTLADRQQRIDAAQRDLILSRADQAAIETAVHELEMAHTETAANVAARDEVLELVRAYPDQDAKDARKALGLISDVGPCSPSR